MKRNVKIGLIASVVFLILIIGISYAFFQYYKAGDNSNRLVAGEIYLKFDGGESSLSLPNAFPETKEEARSRTDNTLTFTIYGKNTTTNKDIWYEILLNEGSDISGKTRFLTKYLRFDLVEITSTGRTLVVDAQGIDALEDERIYVSTVNRNTTNDITRTYELRMWLSDSILISDTNPNADYTTSDFRNSYANVKVSVYGDFVEKLGYFKRTTHGTGWDNIIVDQKANITTANFVSMEQSEINTRYNNSSIKYDATDTSKTGSKVYVWLENDPNKTGKYIMNVASTGTIVFPSTLAFMFQRFSSLETVNFNNVDTSQVTNMEYLFSYCSVLSSLDLSSFNTSKVNNMDHMFSECRALTSLNLSSFNTSQVIDMAYMFDFCSVLSSLDLSGWDTSKVKYMDNMFSYCSALSSLDVSKFNTSQVTNMSSMFRNCSNLSSLDVSNFNTSQVTSMSSMFSGCSNLSSLDISNFTFNDTLIGASSNYQWMFSSVGSANDTYTAVTVNSSIEQTWILGLSTSNRPSGWTDANVVVKTA